MPITMQVTETRSMYINPLIRAAMYAPADREVTSITMKGKFAAKRAATWAKNNPTRFISAVARHGVVIINCYKRSEPGAFEVPFKMICTHMPAKSEPKSKRAAIVMAALIDEQLA